MDESTTTTGTGQFDSSVLTDASTQYHVNVPLSHGSEIVCSSGSIPLNQMSVINLEQCCVCSVFYEQQQRPIPQIDLNRSICKVLDITVENTFYREYLSICVNCATLLRKFDRLRVELEFLKTQLVTHVIESLTQLQGSGSVLDKFRNQILNRWCGSRGTSSSPKKSRNKEGFTAVSESGDIDLSWAASNNLMKNSTVIEASHNWAVSPATKLSGGETVFPSNTPPPASPDFGNDDDNCDNDHVMDEGEADVGNQTEESNDKTNILGFEKQKSTEKNKRKKGEGSSSKSSKKKKPAKKKKSLKQITPHICTTCGRLFTKAFLFKGHQNLCIKDDTGLEKDCSICMETHGEPVLFETWVDFKQHVESHHPVVTLESCRFCRLRLLPFGIKHHKCRSVFNKVIAKDPIFQCDRCDRRYNSRANLTDHVRRIHKDEQHTCDVCGKTYGSPLLLKLHKERHVNFVSQYSCPHCGICLSSNYSLKQHIRRHTGEQLFQCKICDKKFITGQALQAHHMVHSNKKPEVCHVCGRGFKLKVTLHRHVLRHGLNETIHCKKCPLCPKAMFRKIWILKKHMEVEHPGTAETEEILEKYKDMDDGPTKPGHVRRLTPGKGRKFTAASKKRGNDSEFESDDEDYDEEETEDEGEEEDTVNRNETDDSESHVPPKNSEKPVDVSSLRRKSIRIIVKKCDVSSLDQ